MFAKLAVCVITQMLLVTAMYEDDADDKFKVMALAVCATVVGFVTGYYWCAQ